MNSSTVFLWGKKLYPLIFDDQNDREILDFGLGIFAAILAYRRAELI